MDRRGCRVIRPSFCREQLPIGAGSFCMEKNMLFKRVNGKCQSIEFNEGS